MRAAQPTPELPDSTARHSLRAALGSDSGLIKYEKRRNDKHVKDALGHLRSVQVGLMAPDRAIRVMAAQRALEEWEGLPR
jgi:hypothetical protein